MKHSAWSKLLAFGLAMTLVLNVAAPAFAFQGGKDPARVKSKASNKKKKGTIEIKNDTGQDCNDLHIYWRPSIPDIEGIKVKETGKDPFPAGYVHDDSKADPVSNHGHGKGDGSVKAGNTVEVKVAWTGDDVPELAGYVWTQDGKQISRSKDFPKAQILKVEGKHADDSRKAKQEAADKAAKEAEKKAAKEAEKAAKDADKEAKKNRGTQKSVAPTGLREETFDTLEGTVRVLLPDDIRPGDIITGTVISEPKDTNSDELSGLVLEIGDDKVPVKDRKFNWTVPAAGLIAFVLFKEDGTPLRARSGQIEIPKPGPHPDPVGGPGFSIPSHGQTGKPVPIEGNFDPAKSTEITIGGQPAEILAESPRQAIVSLPRNLTGAQDVVISEAGQKVAEGQMGLVRLSLSASKLNLLKGESAQIKVRVEGLEPILLAGDRLEVYFDPAYAIVVNDSPEVIEFFGPGSEPFQGGVGPAPKPKPSIGRMIRIDAKMVKNGVFKGTLQVRAKQAGGFRLSAHITG